MALQHWPCVKLAIQSTLNEAALQRLDRSDASQNLSPLKVMEGIKSKRAVLRILLQDRNFLKATTMTRAQVLQKIMISELQKVLEEMLRMFTGTYPSEGMPLP